MSESKKKNFGRLKFIISLIIICLFIWFLIVSPSITFHNNENKMRDAAKRYYEINSSRLPTGTRVGTITLNELYSEKYLDGDFYVPYTNTLCDQTNSWVKVKRNSSGDYDYMVYLNCGVLQSNVDHKGPTIKLRGSDNITIGVGDKYSDAGVDSVVDNKDGKMSTKSVTIKGGVDTNKVGTYKIVYSAYDSLKNKGTITRTVKVVKRINSVVKKDLGKSSNYTGNPTNNYVRLSNIIFRIYGIDNNDNVILVSGEDISNVNYTKIRDWLDNYFYKNLNTKTKNMIVKSKYCNMKVTDNSVDTNECVSYTNKINVYIPSVVEVNKASQGSENFMRPSTMSWVSNYKSDSKAYVTRDFFYDDEEGKTFLPYDSTYNFGVRPMITIKGTSNIIGGDGSIDNPYTFGDSKKLEGGESISKTGVGEYIKITDNLYRVVSTSGGVKVISEDAITNDYEPVEVYPEFVKNKVSYNPTDKNSVAYFINNRVNDYIDTSLFATHSTSVPIYKNKFIYGTEDSKKSYKAKLFAPNMYEMFSAQSNLYGHTSHSYWLLNSSRANNMASAITDIGVPLNEKLQRYMTFGVRVCAYMKDSVVVTSGSGTHEDPYIVK